MSLKIVCDRCGRVVTIKDENTRSFYNRRLNIFNTPTKHNIRDVDLCSECRILLRDYMDKAESYFMNNTNDAIDIFEKSKYYKE